MEMMTLRKQDSQAAVVVQNLMSDRLLVSVLAEKTGDRCGGNSRERGTLEWVPFRTL